MKMMSTPNTKIIKIPVLVISVALLLVCAGIISFHYVSERFHNDSYCQNCPPITQEELDAGWYYGFIDQKKPGTPDTWLHKGEGTRSAMWFDPDLVLVEPKFLMS